MLVVAFPFLDRHAIDCRSGLVIVHIKPAVSGRSQVPFRQAVPAEAGQIHLVNILNIAAFLEVFDKPAKCGGLDFFFSVVVHFGFRKVSRLVWGIGSIERENNNIPVNVEYRSMGRICVSFTVRE